jgi:hypothetical protein
MAIAFLRVILYFGLFLLVISLFALAIVPRDAPGFVAAVLSVSANVITVGGAIIILRLILAREARREKQAAENWKTFGERVSKNDTGD